MAKTIAIIGGTGKEGKGLAYRWAKAGHHVFIGSRTLEKAEAAVKELEILIGEKVEVYAAVNQDAVRRAEIAVLTVPFAAHRDTLEGLKDALKGKILIDVCVPIVPPKVAKVQMPEEGSATQQAKAIVGEDTLVCCAFQNISYERLMSDEKVECDVIVCGEKDARPIALELVKDTGLIGWDGGQIENAVIPEGLTSILIGLNMKYKVPSSGIRITGIE
ncbi:MAG: NADPH-dependent F420 reductase [Anaerolineaceae bacterium]|nr:NADPH-dependent F420 reductase [Anaerolineaceae bacterium]